MSNISKAFDHGKALITFITCGDPDLGTTYELVLEIARSGADLIELGIPFSDPMAEGPVIQEANIRAFAAGVTTDKVFDLVRRLRAEIDTPLVFMTYANVVFSYGYRPASPSPSAGGPRGPVTFDGTELFIGKAAEAGIDGLILPDLPYEEKEEFAGICRRYGVDLISLIAPTSEGRIAKIAGEAEGFIYVVSSLGVTGVRSEISTDIGAVTSLIREYSSVPCAVGFGISGPEAARKMAGYSDGAIVGSAIIKIIKEYGRDSVKPVGEFVRSLKEAVSGA